MLFVQKKRTFTKNIHMREVVENVSDKDLVPENHHCKDGGCGEVVRNGYAKSKDGGKRARYRCKLCGETFYKDGKRIRESMYCNDLQLNKLIMHLYIEGFKPFHIYNTIKSYQMRDEKSLLEHKRDRLRKFKAWEFHEKIKREQHRDIKSYVENFISCVPQSVQQFVDRLREDDFEAASINCNRVKKEEERTLYKLIFEEKESQVLFGFSTNCHNKRIEDTFKEVSENMESNRPTEQKCNECDKYADTQEHLKYRVWRMLRRRKFSEEKTAILINFLKKGTCMDNADFNTHYLSRREVEEFNNANEMPWGGYIRGKKF